MTCPHWEQNDQKCALKITSRKLKTLKQNGTSIWVTTKQRYIFGRNKMNPQQNRIKLLFSRKLELAYWKARAKIGKKKLSITILKI